MLVISDHLVLATVDPADLDRPVIGWHNVVRPAGLDDHGAAQASYPVSNLANPATHLQWRSAYYNEHSIDITTDEVDPIDYLGIVGHNWGSDRRTISISGLIDGDWVPLVPEIMPADDSPLLFRFLSQSLSQLRIGLSAGTALPRASSVYVGKLLELERKIWVGHTPLPHARKTSVANGRSESGNFLGRIILGEWRESTVPLSLISPDWYRENMDPQLAAYRDLPFFFAWRPLSYPREVGYGWLIDDPMPAPVGPSNLLAFDLKIGGVA